MILTFSILWFMIGFFIGSYRMAVKYTNTIRVVKESIDEIIEDLEKQDRLMEGHKKSYSEIEY